MASRSTVDTCGSRLPASILDTSVGWTPLRWPTSSCVILLCLRARRRFLPRVPPTPGIVCFCAPLLHSKLHKSKRLAQRRRTKAAAARGLKVIPIRRWYACGDDPVYVAEQGGWADPSFPIKVYAKAVRRRERLSGAHREAFGAALDWAAMGSGADKHPSAGSTLQDTQLRKRQARAEI